MTAAAIATTAATFAYLAIENGRVVYMCRVGLSFSIRFWIFCYFNFFFQFHCALVAFRLLAHDCGMHAHIHTTRRNFVVLALSVWQIFIRSDIPLTHDIYAHFTFHSLQDLQFFVISGRNDSQCEFLFNLISLNLIFMLFQWILHLHS